MFPASRILIREVWPQTTPLNPLICNLSEFGWGWWADIQQMSIRLSGQSEETDLFDSSSQANTSLHEASRKKLSVMKDLIQTKYKDDGR